MSDVETHERRAERGREIIAQVRELEAADKARFEAFAETIKSENKKFIHRRSTAAAMVAEAIGTDFSEDSLRKTDCDFVVIHKVALYSDDGLRELAERILDSAPLRRGKPDKRRNPIRETV
jgi:hypothetical protein